MTIIPDFITPPWLDDQDANTIQARMMGTLPDDIDDTEGGFPWDFTMPTALEKSEMLEFHLVETLKIMHPMWSYGEYLDYHAQGVGIKRRNATEAVGMVTVTGIPGTVIPKGFLFAVPASGNQIAIPFKTLADAVIEEANEDSETGQVDIQVEAEIAGVIGNVAAKAISIMASPSITGIVSISNQLAFTGGTEAESDDSLRDRIMEINEAMYASFTGCDSDYKRWAKEVDGVGEVLVVPEWNGPGTVKVVVLDANGEPANQNIIDAVIENIVSPNDRMLRKAPIGATVTIAAPESMIINISFNLKLTTDTTEASVLSRFTSDLLKYFNVAKENAELKYNQIVSLLAETEGVDDFSNLTVNRKKENINIASEMYPVIGTINTVAEVE